MMQAAPLEGVITVQLSCAELCRAAVPQEHRSAWEGPEHHAQLCPQRVENCSKEPWAAVVFSDLLLHIG